MGTADEVSVTIPLCYKVISSTFLRSRQASQRRNDVDDDNDNNDDAAAARVQIFQGFLSWACRCYDRIASRLVKSTGVKETKNGAEHAWDKKLFFTTELNLWNSNLDRFKVIKMFRLFDASASMDRLKRGSNPFPKRNEGFFPPLSFLGFWHPGLFLTLLLLVLLLLLLLLLSLSSFLLLLLFAWSFKSFEKKLLHFRCSVTLPFLHFGLSHFFIFFGADSCCQSE